MNHISGQLWYHKGFIAGLKCSASQSDSEDRNLSCELAEVRIKVFELGAKLQDATDILEELQNAFQQDTTTCKNTRTYASVASSNLSPLSTRHDPPLVRRSSYSRSGKPRSIEKNVEAVVPNYYTRSLDPESQISVERTLKTLFHNAQSGDAPSLSLVKAMCREAHGTESDRKTFGQVFLLAHWRNPQAPSFDLSSQLRNPQSADPPEVWVEYYTRYPHSLPKGVRLDPTTESPLYSDIVASRILAHVRPTISQTRVEFNAAMISLFTTRGEYKRLVVEHQIEISPVRDYRPYEEHMKNHEGPVIALDVARHYARCGVSIEAVEKYIEGWSIEYAKAR